MLCTVFVGSVALINTYVEANADTVDSQENVQELKRIDQKITDNLGDKTISQQTMNMAVESLSNHDKSTIAKVYTDTVNQQASNPDETYQIDNIGGGFTVVSSGSDVEEGEEPASPLLRSSFNGDVTKKYGNRQYIMTYGLNIHGYGIDSDRLAMHYTLGKSGITMRYSSTAGTYSLIGNISSSAKTTDKVATKVGANVNAYGKYHAVYTEPIAGDQMSSQTEIHGAVKIKSWNKTKKTMKLYESHTVQ